MTSGAQGEAGPEVADGGRWPLMILFFALVTVGVGQSILFAVMPPLGRELGLTEVQVGSIVSFSAFVFFLFGPIWGRRSDAWGRKPIILTGLIGYTVTTFAYALIVQMGFWGWIPVTALYVLLVVARMGYAAISSATYPSSQAFIVDVTPVKERTAGVALMGAAFGAGTIMGPAVGGGFSVFGLVAPLYAASGLALVGAIGVLLFLKEPAKHPGHAARRRLRFHDRRIRPYLVIMFVMQTVVASTQQSVAFYFQDRLGLGAQETAQQVALALMGMAAASLFVQLVLVRRYKWPPRVLIRAGVPFVIAGSALLTLGGETWTLALALVIFGTGAGLIMPGVAAAATLVVSPQEQGMIAGVSGASGAAGFIVGPILGPALYGIAPTVPFAAGAIILAALYLYILTIHVPSPDEAAT